MRRYDKSRRQVSENIELRSLQQKPADGPTTDEADGGGMTAAVETAEDDDISASLIKSALRTFFVVSALSFHSVVEGEEICPVGSWNEFEIYSFIDW